MKKEKLTLYQFLELPEQEQDRIVFDKGRFVEYKLSGEQRFALYAIDLFFVEVEYDNENYARINKKAFVSGEILNKYVED